MTKSIPPPRRRRVRVIQLGLRREALAAFRGPAFGEGGVQDVTAFVKATAAKHGREATSISSPSDTLLLPAEVPYPVRDPGVAQRLGVDFCASPSSTRASAAAPQAATAAASSPSSSQLSVPSPGGAPNREYGGSCGGQADRRFDTRILGIDSTPPPAGSLESRGKGGAAAPAAEGKGRGRRQAKSGQAGRKAFDARQEYEVSGAVLFWQPPSVFSQWTPSTFVIDEVSLDDSPNVFKRCDSMRHSPFTKTVICLARLDLEQPATKPQAPAFPAERCDRLFFTCTLLPRGLAHMTVTPFCSFGVSIQVTYMCAEQYMMAEKARLFGDEQAWEKILDTANPKRQRVLGRGVRDFDQGTWVAQRKAIVERGTYAKFTQNRDMRKHLLGTGEKVGWGCGQHQDRLCVCRSCFQ